MAAAGRMTVLFFMIIWIQCLRIERANGLEASEKVENPEKNSTSSPQVLPNTITPKALKIFEETKNTTTIEFPTPSSALPDMVKKAKEFARHYLSSTDLKRLRVLVKKNRENGTETEEIRRLVVGFLNKVLNQTAKQEINQKRDQLQHDFGNVAILPQ